MTKIFKCLSLMFFHAFSLYAENSVRVLVYGMINQNEGMAVYEIQDEKITKVIDANSLRPESIKDDWRRDMRQLRPLAIKNGKLYYYLPVMRASEGFDVGVYQIRVDSESENESPMLLVKTPILTNIISSITPGNYFGITELGDVLFLSLDDGRYHHSTLKNVLFVSSLESETVIIVKGDGSVFKCTLEDAGESRLERIINGRGFSKCFALKNAGITEYLIEINWKIGKLNVQEDAFKMLANDNVTCSTYNHQERLAYFFSASESDGRTLYKWNVDQDRASIVAHGVFNDTLISYVME